MSTLPEDVTGSAATLNAFALGCGSVALVQAVDVRHADVRDENAVAAAAMIWAAMTRGLIKLDYQMTMPGLHEKLTGRAAAARRRHVVVNG